MGLTQLDRIELQLKQLLALTTALTAGEQLMADALEDLTTQVAANTDAESSAITLLNGLHQLLIEAGTDPAKLAALTAQLAASKDALAAAILANTPAEE